MSNLIQIKRSLNTAVPVSLANGELAWTSNGDVLYIGANGVVEAIGGVRNPGTLTANQALVANSTSYLDVIKTANLYIGSESVNSINAVANTTHLGAAANNELATSWAVKTYVDSSISYTVTSGSSDTQVLFNNNGIVGGDAGLTYNSATDTLTATNFSGNGALVTSVDAATVGGNTAGDLRSYADTAAGTAYSNAASYADTVAGTAYSNAASYADSAAATAYSNATSYADSAAATAYSNATSYADSAAATAYSNGTSYTDTAAGTAYANAMSDTLSRNGTYTGDNIFQGTSTFQANVALGDATADIITYVGRVGSAIVPSANVTYSLGTNELRWDQVYANNIQADTAAFGGDVTVSGDLTVSGNVTYISASELTVTDPLIHLAANNESSDAVDIGFIGHYSPDGGSTKAHTGLFRDTDDGYFHLFTGSQQASLDTGTAVVNTTATGYTIATLVAYLESGALSTNSSAVEITANSTVSVAITANTLSLSTALAGTSGGTGKSTMTNQAILVGNSSNGYDELALGTAGYVLQSDGSSLVYGSLDGGSF